MKSMKQKIQFIWDQNYWKVINYSNISKKKLYLQKSKFKVLWLDY